MNHSIYIAGSSLEIERAERACAACAEMGWEVLSDWPAAVRSARKHYDSDRAMPQAMRINAAVHDGERIQACDVFWLLVPSADAPSIGAWVEFGLALRGAGSIICSGDTRASIFLEMAGRRFSYDTTALRWLRKEQNKWLGRSVEVLR